MHEISAKQDNCNITHRFADILCYTYVTCNIVLLEIFVLNNNYIQNVKKI